MSSFLVIETVSEKFEEFIDYKKSMGVCDATLTTYRNHFKAINIAEGDIDGVNWENVIQSVGERQIADYSKISYLKSLKAFMNWLGIKPLPRIPKIETVKETYTDEELRKLIVKPKRATFAELRTWALIQLTLDTGLRASSLRNIQIKDIADNSVIIRHNKTRKVQYLPFSQTTQNSLNTFLRYRGTAGSEYLFCDACGNQLTANGLKLSVKRYNEKRGIHKTSLHMFRHTFAKKWLLDCNGNAFTLQKMLGHSTMEMTRHYTNIWDADLANSYVSPLEKLQRKQIKVEHSLHH